MPAKKNYPGAIDRHGAAWRIRLCVGGQRHTLTCEGTLEDAEAQARTEYDRLRGLEGGEEPIGMRVSQLIKRFKDSTAYKSKAPNTRTSYDQGLAIIREYFVDRHGDPRVDRIRRAHVLAFMDWRARTPKRKKRTAPPSARTVAKDRVMLHILFAFAEELEVVAANPVRRVKPPKSDGREPVILSADQLDSLLDACGERPMLRAYVLLLAEAGLRCESEALWLRWQDVDLEAGFLTVEGERKGARTKSGRARVVPLTPRLRAALRDHAAAFRLATYDGERSPWIFHHTHKRRHHKAGQRIQSLRNSFEAAVERAGLPAELRQHDLRHTRVTRWLAEGKPIHLVRQAMGHSTVKVTEGYLHLVPDHLRQLVEEPGRDELRALA